MHRFPYSLRLPRAVLAALPVVVALTAVVALAACGGREARQETPPWRQVVLTIEGVTEGSEAARAVRQRLETVSGFDTIAWRDGRLHCFTEDMGSPLETLRARLEDRLGDDWKIATAELVTQGPRFGTRSGTKSGPR